MGLSGFQKTRLRELLWPSRHIVQTDLDRRCRIQLDSARQNLVWKGVPPRDLRGVHTLLTSELRCIPGTRIRGRNILRLRIQLAARREDHIGIRIGNVFFHAHLL